MAKDILAVTDQAELSRAVSVFLGDAVSVSFAELLVADPSAPVFRGAVASSRSLPRTLIRLPGAGADRDAVPVDDLLKSMNQVAVTQFTVLIEGFEWEVPAGKTTIRVEEILYQPEAAANSQA